MSEALTLKQAMDLAVAHQNAGRRAEAVDVYRAILQARPDLPAANHNLALLEIEVGRTEVALERLTRALAATPDQPVFQNTQGSAFAALDRLEEAATAFRRAASLDPAYTRPRINLGAVLSRLGRHDEAAAAYREALAVDPRLQDGWLGLHDALLAAGDRDGARATLERYLRDDPSDRLGARAMLASHGLAPPPERASPAQMEALYAARARTWDAGQADYFAADLVADAAAELLPPEARLVDLGCGTGLVGETLRAACGWLEGVDLSAEMLRVAQAKNVYDELCQGDIVEHLAARVSQYDAITCAATLIHFGDLTPAFRAAAGALRPGGVFVLTLFPNPEAPDTYGMGALDGLAQGGVFRHGAGYVARVAAEAGLEALRIEEALHELNKGEPVSGLLVICRRPAA